MRTKEILVNLKNKIDNLLIEIIDDGEGFSQ